MSYVMLVTFIALVVQLLLSYLNYISWVNLLKSVSCYNYLDIQLYSKSVVVTTGLLVLSPILYIIHYFTYFWLLLGVLVCASTYLIVRRRD